MILPELTKRQREVLKEIARLMRVLERPPKMRELGGRFGISHVVVWEHVTALRDKGYLSKARKNKVSNIRLTERGLQYLKTCPTCGQAMKGD